ncbi:glycosyltransferase family 2 protein [Bacteroides eggerthii]|jgi:glycosyltransferase involved in cell wall biosynthesis|uniref:glycosyltransferase family 2 protein n=1 Tax=Bacteroides eggerthii TaxID=28111 RepID=UPI0022E10626|nr:glycosyltransferase family 2 protein [Bacteroides eggerthii]
MKISVVTVCYNAADTIEKTMLSVLNQTYHDIEYIIIDGGSTDGTVEIIRKYADRIAYWVSEPDKGIYDAMNKGIKVATGDFLFFLGADDILIIEISAIIGKLCCNTILYGGVELKSSGKILHTKFSQYSLVRNNVPHQGIFYPRSLFLMFTYDTNYKIYADWLLNIQCLYLNVPAKKIDEPIVLYNDNGISGNEYDSVFLNNQKQIIKKYLGYFPFLYFQMLRVYRCLRNICKLNKGIIL